MRVTACVWWLKEAGRITKDGYMIVTSEKTRRQHSNHDDAVDKLRAMIEAAADDLPREPTAEQLAVQKRRYTIQITVN